MPTLHYFGIRARAEPMRLLLADRGVAYDDVRVGGPSWSELKPTLPFGQLPAWTEDDGTRIVQSQVILHHLGDKYGAAPRDEHRLRCRMASEEWSFVLNRFFQLIWSSDFEAEVDGAINDYFARKLDGLDRHLAEAEGPYWCGPEPVTVDYQAWAVLDFLRNLAPSLVDERPHLKALYVAMEQRPNLAAYLASDKRPKTIAHHNARFGGSPETSGR